MCSSSHLSLLENNPGRVTLIKQKKKVVLVINLLRISAANPLVFFLLNKGLRKLGIRLAHKKRIMSTGLENSQKISHTFSLMIVVIKYISHFREYLTAYR